ncbi:flagellar filament capping protein FliD [Candidatus Pacearchaeota archaeon]|nr:flagellar filament capping protein FliD [Candidatus Pacearchaeota archaeon]
MLSSPGIGSGLDVKGIVSQLVSAAAAGPSRRFNAQEAQIQAKLSALGTLKSGLSEFKTALAGLTKLSLTPPKSVSLNNYDFFSASAASDAAVGSYNVEVQDLAQAHKLASKGFANTTDSIGSGELTFRFGTYDSGPNTFSVTAGKAAASVTIDSSNDSMEGIRDAVNGADIGVTATIINDGTNYRLMFSSDETGAENSLEITVSGDSQGTGIDDNGLSQLAYDPTAAGVGTGKNLSEQVIAQDAKVIIDNFTITHANNSISDAIQGVTLNLKKVELGTTTTITITENKANVAKSVGGFVEAYNTLNKTIASMSSYNPETEAAGVLLGDSTLRSISNQVSRIISNTVPGLDGSAYRALADVGLKTERDGALKLDSSVLSDAVDSNYEDVVRLFSQASIASDSLIDATYEGSEIGTYAVNISQLATQGSYAAATNGSLIIDANNDSFSLKVDDVLSTSITLSTGTYTDGDALAAEIQSKINGDSELSAAGVAVKVNYVIDHFEIISDRYGSESKVEIISVDTNSTADLGFSVATGTDGLDVEGSIGGATAEGNGQVLTGTGHTSGIELTVRGGGIGDRGSVTVSQGFASSLDKLLTDLLDSKGVIDSRTESLNGQASDIGEERERLESRLESLQARYLRQFSALDLLLSRMQATSSYLAQQMAAMPGPRTNK